jgi:3-hydroxyisobutyrate dehydrogenase-like beta-hydroxyacid dehydrogenase
MRVGFAGLGHMGLPMAARLAAHGFPLTVWNRTFLGYKREAYLSAGGAPVSFTTALMAKDLELALGIATGASLPLPVTTAARRFLDQACAEGFADADFACVAALLRGEHGGTQRHIC